MNLIDSWKCFGIMCFVWHTSYLWHRLSQSLCLLPSTIRLINRCFGRLYRNRFRWLLTVESIDLIKQIIVHTINLPVL